MEYGQRSHLPYSERYEPERQSYPSWRRPEWERYEGRAGGWYEGRPLIFPERYEGYVNGDYTGGSGYSGYDYRYERGYAPMAGGRYYDYNRGRYYDYNRGRYYD